MVTLPTDERCPLCSRPIKDADFQPHPSNPKLASRHVECACGWRLTKHINIEIKRDQTDKGKRQ